MSTLGLNADPQLARLRALVAARQKARWNEVPDRIHPTQSPSPQVAWRPYVSDHPPHGVSRMSTPDSFVQVGPGDICVRRSGPRMADGSAGCRQIGAARRFRIELPRVGTAESMNP